MTQEKYEAVVDLRRKRVLGETTRIDLHGIASSGDSASSKEPVLSILGGPQVGRTIVLDSDELTLGRDAVCDIVVIGRGISRTQFTLKREDNDDWTLLDKSSSNGTFLNSKRIEHHQLSPGDQIRIGLKSVLKFSYEDLADITARVRNYEESIRDPLTGVYNRRYFMSQLTYHTNTAEWREPLSVLLFDIDDFKLVNDRYGHPTGDIVIKKVTDCVLATIRSDDVFCRHGGEEFALMLPSADVEEAQLVGDRIRHRISQLRFRDEDDYVRVTASCGISTVRKGGPVRAHELMQEADDNLYQAKRDGRNRTVGPASFCVVG